MKVADALDKISADMQQIAYSQRMKGNCTSHALLLTGYQNAIQDHVIYAMQTSIHVDKEIEKLSFEIQEHLMFYDLVDFVNREAIANDPFGEMKSFLRNQR